MNAIDMTGTAYYHSQDDVRTLAELARMLPADPVVVNIGVAYGTSILAMLEARDDLYVFGIDVDKDAPALANLAGIGRWCFILGRSQDAGHHWPIQVDMVFVDGSHARALVEADIDAWLPYIKPGGIIAFDDYDKPICPGVKPAVDECMAGYERILLVDDIIAFRVK